MTAAGAVYVGRIRHRRFAPRERTFGYSLYLLYLDTARLPEAFEGRWLWSVDRANVASFRRRDYFGPSDVPLDTAVRDEVERQTGRRPAGPVRVLTQVRHLGYVFNPVSIYYCWNEDDTRVEAVVADITNTPWNETHAYVFEADERSDEPYRFRFAKRFHVSPFQDMDSQYDWRFPPPGERLTVHMDCLRESSVFFDATLTTERRPLDGATLAKCLARYPLMTGKAILGIYWQALVLWATRMPFYEHPRLRATAAAGTDGAANEGTS